MKKLDKIGTHMFVSLELAFKNSRKETVFQTQLHINLCPENDFCNNNP